MYKKLWPENNIYLISQCDNDPAFDSQQEILQIKRIELSPKLYQQPLDTNIAFAQSLVIFDDIDNISDKKILEAVRNIRDRILETGRKSWITCIVMCHSLLDGKNTKKTLSECTDIVLFPSSGNFNATSGYLTRYFGLNTASIRSLMDRVDNSRYMILHKNHPQYCMCEQKLFSMNSLK
jgi:hypothetical protein